MELKFVRVEKSRISNWQIVFDLILEDQDGKEYVVVIPKLPIDLATREEA